MLYALLGVFLLMIILGSLIIKAEHEELGIPLVAFGILFFIIALIALFSCLGRYNSIKSTAKERLAIYEEQNKNVLEQLEPLVNKYMDFEKDTFKDLKPSSENLLLLSQTYPELKSDTFVQTQINIILKNQRKITDLRLSIASLNAYKLWIGVGAY